MNAATSPSSDEQHTLPAARNTRAAGVWVRRRNALVFFAIVVLWLLLDVASKRFFNAFEPGELVAGPFAGIFDFRLVHNTGAAWGLFGDSTFALGVLACVVCVVLALYLLVIAPDSSLGTCCGIALVFAGGVGNAIDRFTLGYVVDFIEPTFIDFPVFNVADVGVTCGVVLFLLALALEWRRADRLLGDVDAHGEMPSGKARSASDRADGGSAS